MGAFGENLRREREMRGVSLAEISQATKIGARMLDAIETERFERLPGGVFNAAFVRQYARYMGLDEDRVVAEFTAAWGNRDQTAALQKDAAYSALRQMVAAEEAARQDRRPLPLLIAVGLLLAGALGVGGWRMWHGAPAETAKPGPAKQQAPPGAPVVPQPSADATAGATDGVNLELQATDHCVIRVSLDGQ